MSIPASPTPIRLKEALLSGNRDTRHCVYRCEDGVVSCQTLPAQQAAELLESGVYFQCPTKAKENAGRNTPAAPTPADSDTPAPDDTAGRPITPAAQMDKRTKEYKEWKASQEDSE